MSHIQKNVKCHHTTNRVLNGTPKTFKGQRFNFNIIWSALKVKRCVSTNFQWLWRWRFCEAGDHRSDPRMGFLHDLCLTPIPMMIMMMPIIIMMMPMKIMMGFLHDLCLTRCGFGNSHAAQKNTNLSPCLPAGVLSDRWFIYQHTSLHTVTPNFNLEEDKGSCWGK